MAVFERALIPGADAAGEQVGARSLLSFVLVYFYFLLLSDSLSLSALYCSTS